jgi:hypothetical protein
MEISGRRRADLLPLETSLAGVLFGAGVEVDQDAQRGVAADAGCASQAERWLEGQNRLLAGLPQLPRKEVPSVIPGRRAAQLTSGRTAHRTARGSLR